MRWLETCCCYFSLRTGSLGAGSWTLFTSTLMVSLQVYNIMSMKTLTRHQIKHGPIKLECAKVLALLEIGFGVILGLLSLILTAAVIKDRLKLILPYIVALLIYQVFDISTLLLYVTRDVKMNSSVWIPDIVMCLINMYCVIVVASFYAKLKKRQKWRPLGQPNDSDNE